MDRPDESKHVHDTDAEDDRARDERADDVPAEGVLGLGGSPVPKMPGDPSAAEDRAAGRGGTLEEDKTVTGTGAARRTPGATSIDMGSGGTGTQIDED